MEEKKPLNTFPAHEERKNRGPEHIVEDDQKDSGKQAKQESHDNGYKLVDVVVLNDYCQN